MARGKGKSRYTKRKSGKKYGKKKSRFSRSAIPQRKNISTKMVSSLPKVGFKPLKYVKFSFDENLVVGTEAQISGPQFADTHAAGEFSVMGTALLHEIIKGSAYNMRITDRIQLKRLDVRATFVIPSEDDQVGTGTKILGGTETIRWMIICDKQANKIQLSTGKQVMENVTAQPFIASRLDPETRKRFIVLHDETFTLTPQLTVPADNQYYSSEASRTFSHSFKLDFGVQYDKEATTGTTTTIWDNTLYLLWGCGNTSLTQFGNTRVRHVRLFWDQQLYYTDR